MHDLIPRFVSVFTARVFLALLAGFLICAPVVALAGSDNVLIHFSETKHSNERQQLLNILQKEISAAESLPDAGKVAIKIAVTDLNHDGIGDVLVYLEQYPFFCGTEGCRFMVYLVDSMGRWKNILPGVITHEDIYLSKVGSRGFRDLVLSGGNRLSWDGIQYRAGGKNLQH